MASTPNFSFLFSGLLCLVWFTADVHSVKVLPDVLKGSSVVLRPVEAVTSITAISWKHGANLAAEWNGEELAFYNIFSGTCSLNTTTGELTINNVRPEHSGVYTPDINLRTRSAMKLRVLSPVPKPSISHDCYPGETLTCTLRCTCTCHLYNRTADRTDDLGDVEVFWIRDDRHEIKGPELQITKDSKEETFICSVKNSVSSENSFKLLNPLLPGDTGVPVWIRVIGTLAVLAVLALLVGWIYHKCRRYRIIREIRRTMLEEEHKRTTDEIHAAGSVTEHKRTTDEIHAAGSVTEEDLNLNNAAGVILRILREGNKRNLSEDSILELLTARYRILRNLGQGPEVRASLDKVEKIMKKYFRGTYDLWLSYDKEPTLRDVYLMIWGILTKKNELKLSDDEQIKLLDVRKMILRILVEKKKPKVTEGEPSRLDEEDQKLKDVDEGIEWILSKREKLKLSDDDFNKLQDVHLRISTMIFNLKERREDEEEERGCLNGASNDTSRSRDPAAERLISSAGPEAEVPV